MSRNEAEKIIERLKNACSFNKFDEPGVCNEYIKYLQRKKYETMNSVINTVVEEESRNVPEISRLNKAYYTVKDEEKAVTINNKNYCSVCDDKGYVIVTIIKDIGGKYGKIPCEHVAFCPFCDVGGAYVYDGRKLKGKDQSIYYVESLAEYLSEEEIQELRDKNIEIKHRKLEREAIEGED